MKYLGLNIDQSLTFKDHVTRKCKAAIINILNIQKIRKYIDNDTAKLLASCLVLSHLDYANGVLCGLPDSTISRLQKTQNFYLFFIFLFIIIHLYSAHMCEEHAINGTLHAIQIF